MIAAVVWQFSWTQQSRHIFDRYSLQQAVRARDSLQELVSHPLFEESSSDSTGVAASWFRREFARAERGLHLDALALITPEDQLIPASESSRLFFEQYDFHFPIQREALPEGFELLRVSQGYHALAVFTLEFPRLLKLQQDASLAGLGALMALSLFVLSAMVWALKHLEKERASLESDARLQQLGRMAAEVVHAVRNPLASVALQVGELREIHTADRETQSILEQMQESVRKINQSLGLMTVLNRESRPRATSLSCNQWLQDAVGAFSNRIQIRLEVMDEDVELTANSELLHNLMENLFLNALDAGATIAHVWARRTSQGISILVEDNGHGLLENEDVFQPFFTTRAQGLGLGLMVVKEAARIHGGEVRTCSSSLGGAGFEIILPV